ncbi:MAG: LysM peptidoglycan-binding domain-containing protein, partial [Candidatus Omnitrophota bacterium]
MDKKLIIIIVSAVLAVAAILAIFQVIMKTDRPESGVIMKKDALPAASLDKAVKDLEEIVVRNPGSGRAESALYKLAAAYENRGDLLKAKAAYRNIIESFPSSNSISKAMESLDNLNIKILFSADVKEGAVIYEIQKGDTLAKIAKKFNTTVDFIVKANDLKSSNIRTGGKLKVVKTKFSIVVDKSQNILTLKADGDVVKTYRVSTGLNDTTPVGTFVITTKIKDPTWYTTGAVVPAASPKNILGSR